MFALWKMEIENFYLTQKNKKKNNEKSMEFSYCSSSIKVQTDSKLIFSKKKTRRTFLAMLMMKNVIKKLGRIFNWIPSFFFHFLIFSFLYSLWSVSVFVISITYNEKREMERENVLMRTHLIVGWAHVFVLSQFDSSAVSREYHTFISGYC